MDNWRNRAQCANTPETYFSTAKSTTVSRACAGCPVKGQCLDLALSSPWEPYGVWGGLSTDEVRARWVNRHPNYRTVMAQTGLPA